MFLGRSRRPVNLGSRKQSTTTDALRNAEKQRSKREARRRETRAAETIQGALRSRWLLNEGRLDLTRRLLCDESTTISSESIAFIIPVLFHLTTEERVALLSRYADSEGASQYCELLTARLSLLWNHRPLDTRICELGFGILRHQNPPHIPAPVFQSLLNLNMESHVIETIEWAAKKDPVHFLAVLLTTAHSNVVGLLPVEVLEPLFNIRLLPDEPKQESLLQLAAKLAPKSADAWPLLSTLMLALDPDAGGDLHNLQPALCNRLLLQTMVVNDTPYQAAGYTAKLLSLFPHSRPDILLHLLLATSPSPLHAFWDAYKLRNDVSLLYVIVELFSYWLLVATDVEFINNSSIGLSLEDLTDLAIVVRDECFRILWSEEPNKRHILSDYETGVLKLLRQLYTRDSRRQLFPPGFWLMEDRIVGQNQLHTSHALDDGLFESMTASEEDDEAMDDADDEPSSARLILKPARFTRILEYAPFFIAFETRVALFYQFIDKERDIRRASFELPSHFGINRDTMRQDAQSLFKELGSRIKNHLRVQFISNGMPERGIDGGGLMKEFLMALATEVFKDEPKSDSCPLFVETAGHTLSPNPVYGENLNLFTREVGDQYFFLGQLIGKCIYENLLVDVEFASFFLAKWNAASGAHSVRSTFDDLYLLDAELYNNMAKLHNIHGENVAALGLDFTILGSQGQEIQLRPHGSKISVTDGNKLEYMRELANFKLNTSLRPQTIRFLQGLGQIIRLEWLNMFNPKEINKLISGETQDIDLEDLKRHTEVFGFEGHANTLANFWKVLQELTPEQRRKFLKFVTSAPKGPLLGFDKLEPHFGIRCAGADNSRLPTSSTCVNLLKLPAYSSIETLREKLIYSIESGAGFDLS